MLHRLAFTTAVAVGTVIASGAIAAELIGLVTDRSGRPQPGAAVELLTTDGRSMQPPRRVNSNAQGQFLIPNIEAGAYRLKCGDAVQSTQLNIGAGVVRFDCRT